MVGSSRVRTLRSMIAANARTSSAGEARRHRSRWPTQPSGLFLTSSNTASACLRDTLSGASSCPTSASKALGLASTVAASDAADIAGSARPGAEPGIWRPDHRAMCDGCRHASCEAQAGIKCSRNAAAMAGCTGGPAPGIRARAAPRRAADC